uniref:Uncharacterized protein n=1 Tax=Cacopsylla melanoneura TaxID=428564 RepID=A0A8D8V1R4_9HEMI
MLTEQPHCSLLSGEPLCCSHCSLLSGEPLCCSHCSLLSGEPFCCSPCSLLSGEPFCCSHCSLLSGEPLRCSPLEKVLKFPMMELMFLTWVWSQTDRLRAHETLLLAQNLRL